MRLFRRAAPPPPAPSRAVFGEWLLERFSVQREVTALTFAELERAIANAASVVIGSAYAAPGAFAAEPSPQEQDEARLVARHTADGFKAALQDRKHTVICWPWEHLATRLAWTATRAGTVDRRALGLALEGIGAAYATLHHDQVASVIEVWDRVAQGLAAPDQAGTSPDLRVMGLTMLAAFRATAAPEAIAAG
ncbi:MAG: hypothetical protein IT302_03255 [Dehalococcoidia bacterium]|nr:hypothetical protein [Dehalococcoidia bacterium]